MKDVLHTDRDNEANFVAAGCTLEASIKIYACRVDSVHTDAFKVLGGFSRTANGGKNSSKVTPADAEGEDEDDDGEDDDEADKETERAEEETKAEKKEKKRANAPTIETNLDNINLKKVEMVLDHLLCDLIRAGLCHGSRLSKNGDCFRLVGPQRAASGSSTHRCSPAASR
jgi:condensin complex subunit 2